MTTLISHLLGDTRTAILAVLLLRPDVRRRNFKLDAPVR
jgi:hypothetical protein